MEHNRTLNKNKTEAWLCAILIFIISYPKWFWIDPIIVRTILPFCILIISSSQLRIRSGSWMMLAYAFQFIFILIFSITNQSNLVGIGFAFVSAISFIPLFFCKPEFWKQITDKFILILAILLIPSIIEYLLATFFDINSQFSLIGECPSNPDRDYMGGLFNVYLSQSFNLLGINRFYAFYDEPGVLGNIIMVLLYIQKFDLKKWYNIVFLVAGLLTFSLAFYFAVIAYYLIFGKMRTKIAFFAVSALLVAVFYSNQDIYELVFKRMEFENGSLAGYNRENVDFAYWITTIPIEDYLFIGLGSAKTVYAASWKWVFALLGIIPCLMYLLSIEMNAIRLLGLSKNALICLILIVVIWIQRPFIYSFFYVFLLIIPQYYLIMPHLYSNCYYPTLQCNEKFNKARCL